MNCSKEMESVSEEEFEKAFNKFKSEYEYSSEEAHDNFTGLIDTRCHNDTWMLKSVNGEEFYAHKKPLEWIKNNLRKPIAYKKETNIEGVTKYELSEPDSRGCINYLALQVGGSGTAIYGNNVVEGWEEIETRRELSDKIVSGLGYEVRS